MGKISGKRKKVESDLEELARLEFLGSLYMSGGRICIPDYVLKACLVGKGGASRAMRAGPRAGVGVFPQGPFVLEYDGPESPDDLWKDETFRHRMPVKVGQARVMRTRPIFEKWAIGGEILFDPDVVNRDQLEGWLEYAGSYVGLCDWRPSKGGSFGRFTVEIG